MTNFLLTGGLDLKLYENDPLAFFVSKPIVFAILVFVLGFCTFVVLNTNYIDQCLKKGWTERPGIIAFRGVIIGDSILLPLVALLQGKFYQKATLDNAGSWLLYDWVPWICIGGAMVYSLWWLRGVALHPTGDWTSIPPSRNDPGGVNLNGVWHFLFYVGIVSTWVTFGVKSFGYLITVDRSGDLIGLEIGIIAAIAAFLGLLAWDYKSTPHWLWERR